MATRTLGVKFEVVGFKEAKDSIEQLKKSIRDSIRANIENINTTRRLDRETASATPKQKPNKFQATVRQSIRNTVNDSKDANSESQTNIFVRSLEYIADKLDNTFKDFLSRLSKIAQSRQKIEEDRF